MEMRCKFRRQKLQGAKRRNTRPSESIFRFWRLCIPRPQHHAGGGTYTQPQGVAGQHYCPYNPEPVRRTSWQSVIMA